MRCPTLRELPPPPAGRTGWPWTQDSRRLPVAMPDGGPWPRLSVVTPSYNQGQFIEETIRSVLLQGYPNLEYMILDGGSDDDTVDIIRKYAPWLTYWVSEKDRGQAHAINKGLQRATGTVAGYINSDDVYLDGGLAHVGSSFARRQFDVFVGQRKRPRPRMHLLRWKWWRGLIKPFVFPFILENDCYYDLPQECVFWSHLKYKDMRLDETYRFCLDVWWFTRIYSGAKVVHTSRQLGVFRIHPDSKSSLLQDVARTETGRICAELAPCVPRVTSNDKRSIISSYRWASVLAIFLGGLMRRRHVYYQYQHPQYLDLLESKIHQSQLQQ